MRECTLSLLLSLVFFHWTYQVVAGQEQTTDFTEETPDVQVEDSSTLEVSQLRGLEGGKTVSRVDIFSQLTVEGVQPDHAGLGDSLTVVVRGLRRIQSLEGTEFNANDLILYLNGRPMRGLSPRVDHANEQLTFALRRSSESRQAWNELLGRPKGISRTVQVGVGLESGREIPYSSPDRPVTFSLILFRTRSAVVMAIFLGSVFGLFVILARRTNIIRDTVPPVPPSGEMRPYSLGRAQMAIWFLLIIGSFVYIYAITGEYNNIVTEQALILMGIGIGTALSSSAIEHAKQNSVYSEIRSLSPQAANMRATMETLQMNRESEHPDNAAATEIQLAEMTAKLPDLETRLATAQRSLSQPISEGVFLDFVTDVDGVSLHRFQMLIWTGILLVIFSHGVWTNLAMPTLDATLLALMGISAGTYLGFKLPERQVEGT